MKNLIVFFLITFASYVSFGQAKANWTLIHENTATWCSICGGWGWNFKEQILNEFDNEPVIFMAVHQSTTSALSSPDAVTFSNNFGGSGQPRFFVDGVDIRANNSNRDQKLMETQWEVEFKSSLEVLAGVELNSTFDIFTKELSVSAEVEFYTDVEDGNYYLGLYLVEDVMNIQANRPGVQLHKNVLRQSFLPQVFENEIVKGGATAGSKFSFEGKIENLNSAPENYQVVAIIWSKPPDNRYLLFNANVDKPEVINTSSSKDEKNISFQSYQSESGDVVIRLDDSFSGEGKVSITDVSGKILVTKDISSGLSTHVISPIYTSGIHFVTLQQGIKTRTEKIFLY